MEKSNDEITMQMSSSKRQKKQSCCPHTTSRDMMFQQAVRKGELSLIQTSIENGEIDDQNLSLAFMTAAKHGHVNILQYLWENNCCSIDIVEPILQRGAMSIACNHGHLECVTFLLTIGANLNHQDCHGMTPLIICCASGRRVLVQLLLNAGADRDIVTYDIHPKKALDFCTSQLIRDILLTETGIPLQYTITNSTPICLRFHNSNEVKSDEDGGDTAASYTLALPFLHFPLTKKRCIRLGKAVSCHAKAVSCGHAKAVDLTTVTTVAVDVPVVLKCNIDRYALDRELRILQELQKQWQQWQQQQHQQQQQQRQGDGLREDSPIIRTLCEEIVVFQEVHGSQNHSNNNNSTSTSTSSSHNNFSSIREHESVQMGNDWFGLVLEKGACDLHGLGSALAQLTAKPSSLSSSSSSSTPPPPLPINSPPTSPPPSHHGRIIIHLAEQCCRIVQAIHQAGRVWCDCKPANFVVFFKPFPSSPPPTADDAVAADAVVASAVTDAITPSTKPTHLAHRLLNNDFTYIQQHTTLKAIDLGGCQRSNTTVAVTDISCTVKFLAPEIARALVLSHTGDDVHGVMMDPKLDSWSLGVTLYQLIHPTFQTLSLSSVGKTVGEVMTAGNGGDPRKLSDLMLAQLATSDLNTLQSVVDSCIDDVTVHTITTISATLPLTSSTLSPSSIAETIPKTMLNDGQNDQQISIKPLGMRRDDADIVYLISIIRSLLRVHPEERATISQAMDSLCIWKNKEGHIST